MAGNNEAIRREVRATFLQVLDNNCVLPRLIKRELIPGEPKQAEQAAKAGWRP